MRLTESRCPTCDHLMDSSRCATEPGADPVPGDLSLCLKCGEALCFGPDLTLHAASVAELLRLGDEGMAAMEAYQKSIRSLRPIP